MAARATSSPASLVEQQDRARVDAEDADDAPEQLLEQLVQLEMRERRVRHCLHPLEPSPRLALGLEDPPVLDRERDAVADELKQLDVVVTELALDQGADLKHAGRLARDEERHAEHRLNPLLRLARVVAVDVEHDEGSFLRGYSAGEASPDGHAATSLDLPLDPDRGPGDELVPLAVEQEDGAGVDVEEPCGSP